MLTREEFFDRARKGDCSTEQLYDAYEAYAICPAIRRSGSFQCLRCGGCCRRPWRVEASVYDVLRWIREGRLDIVGLLEYAPKKGPPQGLAPCEMRSLEMMCGELMDQDEGLIASLAFTLAASREGAMLVPKKSDGCIYYDGSGCVVYETRPDVCARFPGSLHGIAALIQ